MEEGGAADVHELRVDGGAAENDFLMQFQADLLDLPVIRPRSLETTAVGAALLAGLGVGLYPSVEGLAHRQEPARIFQPSTTGEARLRSREEWRRAVACARRWKQDPGAAR